MVRWLVALLGGGLGLGLGVLSGFYVPAFLLLPLAAATGLEVASASRE